MLRDDSHAGARVDRGAIVGRKRSGRKSAGAAVPTFILEMPVFADGKVSYPDKGWGSPS